MAGASPLLQLRKLREEIRCLDDQRDDLSESRSLLICTAIEQGFSQQQVAIAAGLSQSRIQEIVTGSR